ncbi:MAG: nuclear transport factor 2 family protein [Acidimicrobiia bacterium]
MNNQLMETSLSVAAMVEGAYAGLAAGDASALAAALTDDVALHVPGTHPLAGEHRGVDGVLAFVAGTSAAADGGERIELVDVLAGRDHVAALCRITATRPGRPPLDNRTVHLLGLRDGRIAEIWLHNFDDLSVNEFWS